MIVFNMRDWIPRAGPARQTHCGGEDGEIGLRPMDAFDSQMIRIGDLLETRLGI
jgi:hypothetical protein